MAAAGGMMEPEPEDEEQQAAAAAAAADVAAEAPDASALLAARVSIVGHEIATDTSTLDVSYN